MNFHTKYRPETYDDVFGNEDIIASLRKMTADPETSPHAFLFSGPTGCGKTTLGRIVARELGAKGNDYREVDSADFRGIDTIREMRKQSQFRPLEGKLRIWLLDECHKLSNDAMNALLKALEDPPSHVRYILCTTEPNKLLATIRGRCTQFPVEPLSERDMKKLLRRVVKAEEATLDKEIYDQIVLDADGHPRDALQILSKVLSVDDDKRLSVARRTAEAQSQTIELCRALTSRTGWPKVAGILAGCKAQDPELMRRAILGYMQAVLLKGGDPGIAAIMEDFLDPFYDSGYPGLVWACYSAVNPRD